MFLDFYPIYPVFPQCGPSTLGAAIGWGSDVSSVAVLDCGVVCPLQTCGLGGTQAVALDPSWPGPWVSPQHRRQRFPTWFLCIQRDGVLGGLGGGGEGVLLICKLCAMCEKCSINNN